eukprot:scaffold1549_cov105-Cylindrotheca_fusiformis.AAC.6
MRTITAEATTTPTQENQTKRSDPPAWWSSPLANPSMTDTSLSSSSSLLSSETHAQEETRLVGKDLARPILL